MTEPNSLAAAYTPYGGTDMDYLAAHHPRFVATQRWIQSKMAVVPGMSVLDVGAHWLHQSLPLAQLGCKVTGLDGPATFEKHEVRALAQAHGIALLIDDDIEHLSGLRDVADNTFDVVLFTEIIEHLTFNPIAMWSEIYRVIRPGGHLVVTTPNYYALRGRVWRWRRFLCGGGSGVDVGDLLRQPTFAHHWKEYSMRELRRYFTMVSSDFTVRAAQYMMPFAPNPRHPWADRVARGIERVLPVSRPQLFVMLALPSKVRGISIRPTW